MVINTNVLLSAEYLEAISKHKDFAFIISFLSIKSAETLTGFDFEPSCPLLLVNAEFPDSYKVEIALPGFKRENLFIQAYGNIMSVSAFQKDRGHTGEKQIVHEFKFNCFDRQIVLPEQADTEFMSAEYEAGILRLHIPKIKGLAAGRHARIAVY